MTDPDAAGAADAALQAAFAAMRTRYVETSRGSVRAFEQLGEQLAGEPTSVDLLVSLRRELHRVHGTAGSLDFREAGRIAAALEELAKRWSDDPALDHDARSAIVLNFARALGSAIVDAGGTVAAPLQRILLIDLPELIAERLVAGAMQLGFAVERMDEAEYLSRPGAPLPVLLVVLPDAARSIAGVNPATPILMLTTGQPERAALPRGAHTMDIATAPREMLEWIRSRIDRSRGGPDSVIVLDDDPQLLMLLRILVEREGLTAHTCTTEVEFRDLLARAQPTLVILDVEMPGTDGIAVLRELRATGPWRELPVLMLSGHSDSETRDRAFDAGASDYMVKPVVATEFQTRLRQLLAARRRQRESAGLHPVEELWQPERTARELESWVRAPAGDAWCVGVVRERNSGGGGTERAAWERECARLAAALQSSGGPAGLSEGGALSFAMPRDALAAVAILESIAAAAPAGIVTWHAGVVTGSEAPLRSLLSRAANAAEGAMSAGSVAAVWDPATDAAAPDVVVVEDDPTLRDLLGFALTSSGMSYRSFVNGPEGLAALLRFRAREHPTIVLLDVDLPGLDGHSLHERLRLERPGAYQVVFVSLHGSEADQLRALQAGALDYITKPVSLRVLMAKLAVWRGRTRAQ